MLRVDGLSNFLFTDRLAQPIKIYIRVMIARMNVRHMALRCFDGLVRELDCHVCQDDALPDGRDEVPVVPE